MTIRYIPIKDGTLIAETDDIYTDGDYVDYLLDLEYAKHPSALIDIPETPQQAGDRAYYDELGKSLASKVAPNVPIGKQVL